MSTFDSHFQHHHTSASTVSHSKRSGPMFIKGLWALVALFSNFATMSVVTALDSEPKGTQFRIVSSSRTFHNVGKQTSISG
jgi:hypothetical protein